MRPANELHPRSTRKKTLNDLCLSSRCCLAFSFFDNSKQNQADNNSDEAANNERIEFLRLRAHREPRDGEGNFSERHCAGGRDPHERTALGADQERLIDAREHENDHEYDVDPAHWCGVDC